LMKPMIFFAMKGSLRVLAPPSVRTAAPRG
jgi:hypothetical protein